MIHVLAMFVIVVGCVNTVAAQDATMQANILAFATAQQTEVDHKITSMLLVLAAFSGRPDSLEMPYPNAKPPAHQTKHLFTSCITCHSAFLI